MTKTNDYGEWLKLNYSKLEMDWLDTISPEDIPLDDDFPDWFDSKYDLFESYCMQNYNDEMGSKREAEHDN